MTMPTMPFFWDGEAMRPRLPRLADKHFVVGETYPMEVREDRSGVSHRHYFASVNAAWENLPEALAERFPSAEHLRKFALIRTGYRDERSIVCASEEEAAKVAAFIKPLDEFAVIAADGPIVTVWTAKSQSVRAMEKRTFQESKDKVLEFLAALLGTSADALTQNAEAA